MSRFAFAGASVLALLTVCGASAAAAEDEVAEVVVTGSLIRGTPEDAALPVDVIGAEDIARQGTPSTVELIKALPASQGVLGDSNQFDGRSGGTEGMGSINLRGLGATRTLVLFNGRRVPLSSLSSVDTNLLPVNAVGRLEVLKDGAAATYGSEAIGGVVNFIAPTNFTGLSVNADYTYVDGSDGDISGGAKAGWSGDRFNVFLAVAATHRSKLPFIKRDFTNQPYADNPEGGYSSINLPYFFDLGSGFSAATLRMDRAGCAALGGSLTPVNCQYHFSLNDNLVEVEDRLSAYGQVNFDLTDDTKFHLDVMYARNVIRMNTSAGYAMLAGPSSTFSATAPYYYVPATNPGLIDFAAKNPSQFPNGNRGVAFATYRPFAFDGNPLFGGIGASNGKRDNEMFRVSGDISGTLPVGDDIGWQVSLTYGQNSTFLTQYDLEISKFQLALRGLGGPGCNYQTGTPGVGPCQYYNPFSNSIAQGRISQTTNPQFTSSSPQNSVDLARWFYANNWRENVNRMFVADLVFNGKLSGVTLPGGEIGWAVGGQYRRNITNVDVSDGWNAAINPCPDSPITGSKSCTLETGPLAYLGTFIEQDLEQDVFAGFAELQLPVTDDLNVQLAARYEDYGGGVGGTFDPKASARWQINEVIALRGSVGTTFRAPPANILEGRITTLNYYGGNFRPVDVYGNPDLKPESALTWSVGAMVRYGGLRATLDYWSFDFKDPLVAEPWEAINSTMFPGGSTANCSNPAYAALKARYTFAGGVCSLASTARLRTNYINGPDQKTSGIDLLADYDVPLDLAGGELVIGGSMTYVFEFKIDAASIDGLPTAPAFDALGRLNYGQSVWSMPEWKGQLYADYQNGPHSIRVTANYISSYKDERPGPFLPNAALGGASLLRGQKISDTLTVDAAYRVFLPWDTTLNVRVANIFDTDPSFARLAPGYDPQIGNPLGRTIKVGVQKNF